MKIPDVVVIGTGYVGLPAALMWARAGLSVVGVDINKNIVRAINEGVLHIREKELSGLMRDPKIRRNLLGRTSPTHGNAFVIAVPTPVHPTRKTADLTFVKAAVESICPVLKKGNLIIIESTIPPLTCKNLLKPLLEQKTGLKTVGSVRRS